MRSTTLLLAVALYIWTVPVFGGWMPIEWMNDPERVDSVRVILDGEALRVDLGELAKRLGIECRVDQAGGRIRLELPVRRLLFTAGTPFVLAEGELRQMPLALSPPGDGFLAPLEPLVALLAEYYPGELLYDPAAVKLLVAPPRHDLFGIRYVVEPGITRVILPAGKLLECRADSLPDGGARLFFPGGTVDSAAFNNQTAEGLVAGIQLRQTEDGVRLAFMPDSGAAFSGLEIESDPPLYVVKFSSKTASGLDSEARRRLEEERDRWALDVVVIDPGHGGKDPGAVGQTGLKEKDVVLDVSLRLRKALEKRGVRIVMTRETDVFIPLHERTKIANSSGGKLFISIHANANTSRRVHGIETYFLAPTKTDRAMKVALRENAVIRFEESRDQYVDLTEENYILLGMAQANFARESQSLAAILQDGVTEGMAMKDLGVDQAGFYVLIGASMPAVLFEMAFISNSAEEKQLRNKRFRQIMADEICQAVMEFLQQSRKEG